MFKILYRSATEWGILFALMRQAIVHPEAAQQAFDLLMKLTTEGPQQNITLDNFAGIVGLLDAFASAGASIIEQRNQRGRAIQSAPNPLQYVGQCR